MYIDQIGAGVVGEQPKMDDHPIEGEHHLVFMYNHEVSCMVVAFLNKINFF